MTEMAICQSAFQQPVHYVKYYELLEVAVKTLVKSTRVAFEFLYSRYGRSFVMKTYLYYRYNGIGKNRVRL